MKLAVYITHGLTPAVTANDVWVHGDRLLRDWLEDHRPVRDHVCHGDDVINLCVP